MKADHPPNEAPRRTRRLPWVVAGLVLTVLVVAAGLALTYRKPRVRLREVSVARLGLGSTALRLDFDVHNPNLVGVRFVKLDYRIHVGDDLLGSGELVRPIPRIPARGDERVQADVDIRNAAALKRVWEARRSDGLLTCAIEGTATFSLFGAPVSAPFRQVKVLKVVGELAWKLKLPRVQRDPLTLILPFEVRNPNDEGAFLRRIEGAVLVGDSEVLRVDQAVERWFEPGQEQVVELPVLIRGDVLAAALKKCIRERTGPRFSGSFKLGPKPDRQ